MAFLVQLLKALLFGVIQGITEWLPVSSTGHLILLHAVMPLELYSEVPENLAFWQLFRTVIQLSSAIAAAVFFRARLWPFSPKRSESKRRGIFRLWMLMAIGGIPVIVLYFLSRDLIEARLSSPLVCAVSLIAFGLLFLLIERKPKQAVMKSVGEISPKQGGICALCGLLSVIPGVTLTAPVITGELLLGFARPMAAEFSLCLAIPVLFVISLVKLFGMQISVNLAGMLVLLVGFAAAFFSTLVVIKSFMHYVRRNDFRLFGLYRIVLGVLILILAFMEILPEVLTA